jgi:hypothetical protein
MFFEKFKIYGMKKIAMCAALTFALSLSAQDEVKRLEIKSASWQFGLNTGQSGVSNLSDFKKLAPNMMLSEADLIGFSNGSGFNENSGPAFSVNIILAKPTAFVEEVSRFNPEFRVGISYQRASLLNLNFVRTDQFRIDTLRSSQTGEEYYVDSIRNQDYSLGYIQQQVMVDGDVTISTNPDRRWKFYTGIGVSLGLSVSPRTEVNYDSWSYVEDGLSDNYRKSSNDYEGSSEEFANKTGFFGRVYIPLGVDFRIGKRKESLKKYHLFIESRQSLNFQTIFELSSQVTTSSVGGFGLRYDF